MSTHLKSLLWGILLYFILYFISEMIIDTEFSDPWWLAGLVTGLIVSTFMDYYERKN